jgi:uncharacterized protein (UPF0332 family)
MKTEDKYKATIRLKDAEEFIKSAKENLDSERYKASLDHSIDATIAANDAFTIFFLEQIPSTDHKEAISLHKEAGKKISENKVDEISSLLEERHRSTYRPVTITKNHAELNLKKANRFLDWVKSKIS